MDLEKYIEKYNNSVIIMENTALGTQCVALVKHYSSNVLGITLGRFGGGAIDGWNNNNNTFKKELWIKVLNNPADVDQVPKPGDILFWKPAKKNGFYGHTAICRKAKKGKSFFYVFEQNTGNGNGKGYDDRARVSKQFYTDLLGWYTPVKNNQIEEKINESQIVQENLDLKAKLQKERGLREQYERENGWLRARAERAILELKGE